MASDETTQGSETVTAPWRRREDWAEGRVVAERRRLLGPALGMSLLAAVLFVPSVWFVWRDIRSGLNSLDVWFFVLLLFAVLTLFFLVRSAYRHTRQAVRFAPAVLRLEVVPVPLGRDLRGSIEAPLTLRPGERVGLELACVARTAATAVESGSREEILWRHESEVTQESAAVTAEGTALPVTVALSASAPEARVDDTGSVRWRLTATVLPSRRWQEVFDLPVFRTAESPAAPQPSEPEAPTSFRDAYRQAKEDLAAGKVELIGGRLVRRRDHAGGEE
jgi:hypothetical protein